MRVDNGGRMKILQVIAPGSYRIEEMVIPAPEPDEVLVEIEIVTTCPRWDIHMHDGRDMFDDTKTPAYPLDPGQPGHEAAGIVRAVGAHVIGLRVGDRVAALEHVLGQGAYAQYMCYREPALIKLPDEVSFKQAAPFELLKCILIGMSQFDDLRGKSILISGLGPAGIVAMQLARIWGAAHVVGIDISATRVDYVQQLGIGSAVHVNEVGEEKFDLGYDCVGAAASVQYLTERVREHVVIFGVLHGQIEYGEHLWPQGFRLESYRYRPFDKRDRELLLDAVHKGLNTECLLTHHIPFSRYEEAVALLKSQQAIKVYTYPGRDF